MADEKGLGRHANARSLNVDPFRTHTRYAAAFELPGKTRADVADTRCMTTSLLAPRCIRSRRNARGDASGGTTATPILDWASPEIVTMCPVDPDLINAREFLVEVHAHIARTIRPVYAMDDRQPASVTVRRGRGSCSQRLAVLEAVARRAGIATRVRGIAVDGSFWYPRFPRLKWLVPDRVILAWPEFMIDGHWTQVGELYGSIEEMSACGLGFTNADGETLFDAIARTAIDWDGRSGIESCDLSAVVKEDLGYFDSRDDLFGARGQTLAWLPRCLADQAMGRRSASAALRL